MGKTIRIMLDPGHDTPYSNQSPVVRDYYEGTQMWKLFLVLKAALEARGFLVGGTKTRVDQAIDVVKRGRMAEGYDALISLHSNACDTESVDRPVGIYFIDDDCGEIDNQSKELAVRMSGVVAEVMGTSDAQQYDRLSARDRDGDGRWNDDYYGVLYGAHQVGVPAIILEHSFHTNARAAKWLLNDANLKKLAEAEADALAEYYGVEPEEEPQAVEKTVFHSIEEVPEWARPTIEKLVDRGALQGVGGGDLDLSMDLIRMLVINDRCGLYG